MPTRHPCGGLPVRQTAVTLWYCPHHMAWWGSLTVYAQDGDDELEVVYERSMEFGPFDTPADVLAWATDRLAFGAQLALAPDE